MTTGNKGVDMEIEMYEKKNKKQLQHLKGLIIQNNWRPNLSVKGRPREVVYFCELTIGVRYWDPLFSMYFFAKRLCSYTVS